MIGIIFVLALPMIINYDQGLEEVSSRCSTYDPVSGWHRATPEEVGLDSTELAALRPFIETYNLGVDSVTIVRHGYVCYEEYFDYYDYSDLHHLFSVTKSIVSVLVGIANNTGYITNLDEPVVDIFPEKTFQNMDARKQAITIRHLLRMQSGLAWDEWNVSYLTTLPADDYAVTSNTSDVTFSQWPRNLDNAYWTAYLHPDPVQYTLDLPMTTDPGTEFVYNSASSDLLSVILTKKTGMNVSDFADDYLFFPLGITDYVWFKDANGINHGGTGLWLRPVDMAKIGYLYSNWGQWYETSIVTTEYVEQSWNTTTIPYPYLEYGYLWWRRSHQDIDYYFADGLLGQLIAVNREKDLVVAITCSDDSSYSFLNTRVMTLTMNNVTVTDPQIPTTTTTTTATTTTTTTTTTATTTPATTEPTTTTADGGPGFELQVLVLGLSLLFIFTRKRRK